MRVDCITFICPNQAYSNTVMKNGDMNELVVAPIHDPCICMSTGVLSLQVKTLYQAISN